MGASISIGQHVVLSILKNQKITISKKHCNDKQCKKYLLETIEPFCSGCGNQINEHNLEIYTDENFFHKLKEEDMEDNYCELNLINSNDEDDEESLLIYHYDSQVKRINNCYNVLNSGSYTMKIASEKEQNAAIEKFKHENSFFIDFLKNKNISYNLNIQIVGAC